MAITVDSVRVAGCTAYGIAIAMTLLRLFERARQHKFGADDAWAALAASMGVIFVAALVVHLGDPTPLTQTTRIAMFYLLAQCFYAVIWCCRLSILASVIRISPPGPRKRILQGISMAFILIWAVLFAQVFWVCETDTVWKQTLAPQCVLGQNVAIAQLITDIMADSVLIAAPLQLLWNVQITNAHRYRLMAVFSSTIVTTASSLAHAYYVLKVGGLEEVMAAIVENGLSLIVCNLAVLVAAIARLTGYGLDHGGDSYNSRGRSQGSYPLSHVTIGSMPTRKQKPTATAVNIGFEDTLSGDHDTNKMHIVDVPDQDDAPWTQAPNKGTSFWDGGRGVQITQEQYVSR